MLGLMIGLERRRRASISTSAIMRSWPSDSTHGGELLLCSPDGQRLLSGTDAPTPQMLVALEVLGPNAALSARSGEGRR